jgi:RNAse (barnase) inhibitor barstar
MSKAVGTCELDGSKTSTLEEFFEEFGAAFLGDRKWGKNLDALNDVLGGNSFGHNGRIEVCWKNADISKHSLGYTETERQLVKRLAKCHPSNRSIISEDLRRCRLGQGQTAFDWLVAIFADHRETVSLVLM